MTARTLRASINQADVGSLNEVAGLWSFQYAPGWLAHPQAFALSPHLPLTAENAALVQARPELSATCAGEDRCLRAIVHTVVKEMSGKIA